MHNLAGRPTAPQNPTSTHCLKPRCSYDPAMIPPHLACGTELDAFSIFSSLAFSAFAQIDLSQRSAFCAANSSRKLARSFDFGTAGTAERFLTKISLRGIRISDANVHIPAIYASSVKTASSRVTLVTNSAPRLIPDQIFPAYRFYPANFPSDPITVSFVANHFRDTTSGIGR